MVNDFAGPSHASPEGTMFRSKILKFAGNEKVYEGILLNVIDVPIEFIASVIDSVVLRLNKGAMSITIFG